MKIKHLIGHYWLTILLVLGSLSLAIGTIVIIFKLKELSNQPVVPNVPQSKPAAQNNICVSHRGGCHLTFVVPTPTPTLTPTTSPTPTLTPTPTMTPSPSPTPTPPQGCGLTPCSTNSDCQGLEWNVCADIPQDGRGKVCVINPSWPDGCTQPTPTPSPSSTPTPTPTPACGEKLCQEDSQCQDLPYKVCADIGSDQTNQKKCVINSEWFDGCTPPSGTTNAPTPTPTVAHLPSAGSSATLIMTATSILLATLGLALLF